jgi:hypothetical protein
MRAVLHALLSVCALVTLLSQGGCAGKREPAQDLLHEIQGALLAGGEDAAKYAPGQLQDVQAKLNALQAEFDKSDYSAVLAEGPALLAQMQQLGEASVARKRASMKALSADWSRLAGSLPDRLLVLAQRVDGLAGAAGSARATGATGPAGIDPAACKVASRAASSLWSKARSAFASGNLEEAVRTAQDVETRVDALTKSLDFQDAGAHDHRTAADAHRP